MQSTFFMAVILIVHLLFWRVLLGVALIGILSSTVFLALVIIAAWRYRRRARIDAAYTAGVDRRFLPPVSILKPVHGVEERLEETSIITMRPSRCPIR